SSRNRLGTCRLRRRTSLRKCRFMLTDKTPAAPPSECVHWVMISYPGGRLQHAGVPRSVPSSEQDDSCVAWQICPLLATEIGPIGIHSFSPPPCSLGQPQAVLNPDLVAAPGMETLRDRPSAINLETIEHLRPRSRSHVHESTVVLDSTSIELLLFASRSR